ncbi:MAG TPA: hypothetical protein VK550_24320 [Polyangiaceae bacterium]|jgi:hypothetical protein|nr:hypothetical protein [Polyangiaceae bacterium]
MDPNFERAFVATSYLIGGRDDVFERCALGSEARSLVRALRSGDRDARAVVLAREAARIAIALEKGDLR